MNPVLSQTQEKSLLDDSKTLKRLEMNHKKNKDQDHTQLLDDAASNFIYEQDRKAYWNPERFSLLWGTPLWDQASEGQRILLNQLYWVAYYSQIISAEIATIFFNQAAAASLYGLEDFRVVRNVSTSLRHRLVEFTEAKECLKPAQPMRPARVC